MPRSRTIPLLLLPVMLVMTTPSPGAEPASSLTPSQASSFARLALKGVDKEYPNKPEHVLGGPEDAKGPKALHPAFYGCYDWHSSVHGHWMLARLLRVFPRSARGVRDPGSCPGGEPHRRGNLKAEADYFARKESPAVRASLTAGPGSSSWPRSSRGWDDPDALKRWSANLKPLADVVASRYLDFFPKQTYPIRTGVHPNTAFGLAFAHDYARWPSGDARLQGPGRGAGEVLLRGKDADVPGLAGSREGPTSSRRACMEADLMRRVLPLGRSSDRLVRPVPAGGRPKGEPKATLRPPRR